ncbi:MAG: hypothetical protein WCC87_18280 [Candidatus Korobacteraceae bacterium]
MERLAAVAAPTEVLDLSCSICNLRKEKRFCPAVHGRICPHCCGEQREVTLDCPCECPYLQQARQHQKPRTFEDLPADEVFPKIEVPEQFLHDREPLIAGVLQTLARLSRSDRDLHDREMIGALANLARSYQTLVGSGLVYEEALPNPAQRTIIETLRQLLQEFREVEHQHLGHTTLRDTEILQTLVFILRLAHLPTSGRPRSRGFIDFLNERFTEPAPSLGETPEPASRIILP